MTRKIKTRFAKADPERWSKESKQSLAYELFAPKEYADRHYLCRRCDKPAVFSAADQKYTYEVKKGYIHQCRLLCPECWKGLRAVEHDIRACEARWADSRESLKQDMAFLENWLDLLRKHDTYEPSRKNTATQNMLRKLLEGSGQARKG